MRQRKISPPPAKPTPAAPSDDAPVVPMLSLQGDIPDDVWTVLQEAGAHAAARLLEMLTNQAFVSYSPTARARLIELALTRAYGPPVKRSIDVSLSSSDADAVAASLDALQNSLPERNLRPSRGSPTIDAETLP